MSTIIDGKEACRSILDRITVETEYLKNQHNIVPGLAVILVGDDPASQVYVKKKIDTCKQVGFHSLEFRLEKECAQTELEVLIDQLNNNDSIHGILVQLPLPRHIDESKIVGMISPAKDVDGFHPYNVGLLSQGKDALTPCTPQGCMLLLEQYVGDITGKHAVVIGRSDIVGKPMAQLLLQANCTVTTVHSRTVDIATVCQAADIVIAAVGQPRLIKSHWVKPGAVVIDVGINSIVEEGRTRLVGDVDYDEVAPKAGAISPVPGGVGPMTIACLLLNTLKASKRCFHYVN